MHQALRGAAIAAAGLAFALPALAAPAHPPVASGISGFAVVGPGGSIRQGSNALGGEHPSTGVYRVHFNSNIKACAYTATIGQAGDVGISPPGVATVTQASGDFLAVHVNTYDLTGTATDLGFHLVVTC